MNPHRQHDSVRPRPRAALMEGLEARLLCRIMKNGEFVIDPPGGGQGHQAIHLHPDAGVGGLNTAEARSNGVVNWQVTSIIDWTPGEHGGPRGAT